METLDNVISSLQWVNFIIAVIGLTGNVTTIVVLAHRRIRCSTSMLLIVMGLYDSVFLVTDMSLFGWRKGNTSMNEKPVHSTVFHVAATGSVYTAVAVTIERYVAVRYPFKAMSHCHLFKMWKPIMVVFVLSIAVNFPRHLGLYTFQVNETTSNLSILPDPASVDTFIETEVISRSFRVNSSTLKSNRIIPNENGTELQTFLNTKTSSVSVDCYHVSVYPPHRSLYCYLFPSLVVLFVPFAMILFLNVLILKTLSLRQQTLSSTMTQFAERGRGLTHAALGITTCFFVFCTFPGIYMIIRYVGGYSFGHLNLLMENISYTLLLINFSTNFILYCFLGRNFRATCLEVFCWHKPERHSQI